MASFGLSSTALLALMALVPGSESRYANFMGVLHTSGTVFKVEDGHEDLKECQALCDGEAACECTFFKPSSGQCELAKGCAAHTEHYSNPDGIWTVSIKVPDVDVKDIYKKYDHTNTRNGFGSIPVDHNRMAKNYLTQGECVDRCTVDEDCDCVVYMEHAQYGFKQGTCWMRNGLVAGAGCDPALFETKGTAGFEVFVKPRATHPTAAPTAPPKAEPAAAPTAAPTAALELGPELVPLYVTMEGVTFEKWMVRLEQEVKTGDVIYLVRSEGKIISMTSLADGFVDELDEGLAPGFPIKPNTIVAVIRTLPSVVHWFWIVAAIVAAVVATALTAAVCGWQMQQNEEQARSLLVAEESRSLIHIEKAKSEESMRFEEGRARAVAELEKDEALARLLVTVDFKTGDGSSKQIVMHKRPFGIIFNSKLPIAVSQLTPGHAAEKQGVQVGWVLTKIQVGKNTPRVVPEMGSEAEYNNHFGALQQVMSMLPEDA